MLNISVANKLFTEKKNTFKTFIENSIDKLNKCFVSLLRRIK